MSTVFLIIFLFLLSNVNKHYKIKEKGVFTMKEKDYELSEEKAKEIGNFLKNRREELGYSTNQMLMKTDIDKSDISRI